MDVPLDPSGQHRISIYQRLLPGALNKVPSIHHKPSIINVADHLDGSGSQTPVPRTYDIPATIPNLNVPQASSSQFAPGVTTASSGGRRISYANPPVIQTQAGLTPLLESVDHAIKDTGMQQLQFGPNMTQDDFTRAVAVATVSALRHQQTHAHSPARVRTSTEIEAAAGGGHGGHDGPSWSRTTSASVLLGCTALYAAIAGMFIPNNYS